MLVKLYQNINWYTYLYREKLNQILSLLFKMEKESEKMLLSGGFPVGGNSSCQSLL